MNRDEQEMALWREAYKASRTWDATSRAIDADGVVEQFRKRFPPKPAAPEAVWYDQPPFSRDYALQPCWIAGDGRVFAGAVYWDTNEWRVYPMGVGQPYSLNGRRVSPVVKPPEPTT